MKTIIYSPKPALSNPRSFFSQSIKDIQHSWELSVAIAKRDLSAIYRQSILGYVWAFLPILATTGIFLFLKSGGAFDTGASNLPYSVYILVGSLLWQVFVDAVTGPLKVVNASRSMIVKINFPRESLVIAAMLITIFNLFIRCIILIPALVYFHYSHIYEFTPNTLYLFPVGIFGLILLGYCIGLFLTPIGLLYKDIQMGITMVMGFWMFMSPVVMAPQEGISKTIMAWNPASSVIDVSRAWLLGVEPYFLKQFLIFTPLSGLLLLMAWVLYRVALPHAISRLGM